MGAQFIHGKEKNPIHALAETHNLILPDDDSFFKNPLDVQFLYQDGRLADRKYVRQINSFLDSMHDDAHKVYHEGKPADATYNSVGEFFQDRFEEYLRSSTVSTEDGISKRAIFKSFSYYQQHDTACDSLYDLSLEAYGSYESCEGPHIIFTKNGYQPILDIIKKQIPDSSIHLNTPVTKIHWSLGEGMNSRKTENHTQSSMHFETEQYQECTSAPGGQLGNHNDTAAVAIETSNGCLIRADHIICTLPIGTLKATAEDMFSPLLPKEKQAAINGLGFGTVDKMFCEWEKPWWKDDVWYIRNFLWKEDLPFELDCVKGKKYYKEVSHSSLNQFESRWKVMPSKLPLVVET